MLADRVQLQQVLVNLIRNAHEACKDREPHILVESAAAGSGVRICIDDNGTGLSESAGDPFSPLTTSKPGGMGLGLAICRTLVEAMGGRIWVDRTSPAGTRICFTLAKPGQEHLKASG